MNRRKALWGFICGLFATKEVAAKSKSDRISCKVIFEGDLGGACTMQFTHEGKVYQWTADIAPEFQKISPVSVFGEFILTLVLGPELRPQGGPSVCISCEKGILQTSEEADIRKVHQLYVRTATKDPKWDYISSYILIADPERGKDAKTAIYRTYGKNPPVLDVAEFYEEMNNKPSCAEAQKYFAEVMRKVQDGQLAFSQASEDGPFAGDDGPFSWRASNSSINWPIGKGLNSKPWESDAWRCDGSSLRS